MPIINTLGKYFSQKDEFNQWEKDQSIKEEQRKKCLETKQFTPEELAAAKKLGARIIDTVDIMDGKSEEASQDVELVTQPIPGLASIAGLAGGGGISYLLGKSFFKNRRETNTEFYEFAQKILEKMPDEDEKGKLEKILKGDKVLNEKNINDLNFLINYDENGEKLSQDLINRAIEQKKATKKFMGLAKKDLGEEVKTLEKKMLAYSKTLGPHVFFNKVLGLAKYPAIGFIGAFIGASIWTTKLQVQSSRVARYQARKNLKDEKNFVIYNDDQINKAKEIAKNMPDIKDSKERGYFGRIFKLIKDNKALQEEAKTSKYSLSHLDLASDEVPDIQKQQQVLNRTVSILNNKAEQYSENMDTAANTILGGSMVGGMVIGTGINWVLDKMNITEKAMNKFMKKAEANYNKADGDRMLKSIYIKLKNPQVKKFVMGNGKLGFTAVLGGILTTIATGPLVLMLTKNASRAGRYSAKKDLDKDPKNFIYVDDKELAKIKDVKPKKRMAIDKFLSAFKLVPKSIVEVFEYKKYKKTKVKEKQKLAEALKQVDVTPEQLKEAKKLKVSLFNTFEEIDDNTQTFSEDTETASDVVQQVMPLGLMATMALPFIAVTNGVLKGKISTGTVLKKVTSFLGKSTIALNSKFFKKQLTHISNGFTETLDKKFNKMLQDNYNFNSLLIKIGEDKQPMLEKVLTKQPMNDEEIGKFIKSIDFKPSSDSAKYFKRLLKDFNLDSKLEHIFEAPDEEKLVIMKNYLNSSNKINTVDIGKKPLGEYLDELNNSEKIKSNLQKFVGRPIFHEKTKTTESLNSYLNSFENDEDFQTGLKQLVTPFIKAVLEKQDKVQVNESIIDSALSVLFKDIKKYETLNMIKEAESKLAEHADENLFSALKKVKDDETVKKMLDFVGLKNFDGLENCKNETSIISKLIENNPTVISKLQKRTGVIAEWGVDTAKAFASEDLIKNYISDYKLLQDFSKDDVIKVSKDVIKIFNNVPASEISHLVSKLVRYQSENPQKCEILLKKLSENNGEGFGMLGKDLLITPDIKKAIVATGATFTAANIFVGYLITAFFADMQLKAGRLGTMNAVKSLSEEANDLNSNNVKTEEKPQVAQSSTSALNMVNDFLKRNASKVI